MIQKQIAKRSDPWVALKALMLFSMPRQNSRDRAGGRIGFEALNAEPIPAIELATEPDESAEVAVLRNFIRTLEGGPSKFDAEVDDNEIRFFRNENTEAEDELDMKIYKNQDPFSPLAFTEVQGLLRV